MDSPTAYSRVVLEDCAEAIVQLRGSTGRTWRLGWCTTVVLLSTVRDVLRKLDAPRTEAARIAVCELEAKLLPGAMEAELYHKFIKKERNPIVHEYRPQAGQNVCVDLNSGDSDVTHTIQKGHYRGRDAIGLATEARNWSLAPPDRIDPRVVELQSARTR